MSKRKRHKAEQIASILKQQEAGLKVANICRQHSIGKLDRYSHRMGH
jgi:hypothetical protein